MNWETALEGAVFSLPAVALHPFAGIFGKRGKGIRRSASVNL
jgi:hypothetical protein